MTQEGEGSVQFGPKAGPRAVIDDMPELEGQEVEANVYSRQLAELYEGIRSENNSNKLIEQLAVVKDLDVKADFGPKWNESIKEVIAGVILLRLCEVGEVDFVADELAKLEKPNEHLLVPILSYSYDCSPTAFAQFASMYDRLSPEQQSTILLNSLSKKDEVRRRFIFEHKEDFIAYYMGKSVSKKHLESLLTSDGEKFLSVLEEIKYNVPR